MQAVMDFAKAHEQSDSSKGGVGFKRARKRPSRFDSPSSTHPRSKNRPAPANNPWPEVSANNPTPNPSTTSASNSLTFDARTSQRIPFPALSTGMDMMENRVAWWQAGNQHVRDWQGRNIYDLPHASGPLNATASMTGMSYMDVANLGAAPLGVITTPDGTPLADYSSLAAATAAVPPPESGFASRQTQHSDLPTATSASSLPPSMTRSAIQAINSNTFKLQGRSDLSEINVVPQVEPGTVTGTFTANLARAQLKDHVMVSAETPAPHSGNVFMYQTTTGWQCYDSSLTAVAGQNPAQIPPATSQLHTPPCSELSSNCGSSAGSAPSPKPRKRAHSPAPAPSPFKASAADLLTGTLAGSLGSALAFDGPSFPKQEKLQLLTESNMAAYHAVRNHVQNQLLLGNQTFNPLQDLELPSGRVRQTSESQLSNGSSSGAPSRLYCHTCNVECLDLEDFHLHMNSLLHSQRMQEIMNLHSQQTGQQLARLKAREHLRQIEDQDRGEDFCRICERHFHGTFVVHRHSKEHKRKERMTKRGCLLCGTGSFHAYPEYVTHIDSEEHKERKGKLQKQLHRNKLLEGGQASLASLNSDYDISDTMTESNNSEVTDLPEDVDPTDGFPASLDELVTVDATGIFEDELDEEEEEDAEKMSEVPTAEEQFKEQHEKEEDAAAEEEEAEPAEGPASAAEHTPAVKASDGDLVDDLCMTETGSRSSSKGRDEPAEKIQEEGEFAVKVEMVTPERKSEVTEKVEVRVKSEFTPEDAQDAQDEDNIADAETLADQMPEVGLDKEMSNSCDGEQENSDGESEGTEKQIDTERAVETQEGVVTVDSTGGSTVNPTELVYDADTATGQEFVVPVTGYFCKLCHKFYTDKDTAIITHCKTLSHFHNYQMSLLGVPTRPSSEDQKPKSTSVKKALFHSKVIPTSRKLQETPAVASYTQLLSNTKKNHDVKKPVKPATKTATPLKRGMVTPKLGTTASKKSTKMGLDVNKNNMVTPASKNNLKSTTVKQMPRSLVAGSATSASTKKVFKTPGFKTNGPAAVNGKVSKPSAVTGKPPIRKLAAKSEKPVPARTETKRAAVTASKAPVKNKTARTVSPDENKAVNAKVTPPSAAAPVVQQLPSRTTTTTPSLKVKNLNSVSAKSANKFKTTLASTKVSRTPGTKLQRSSVAGAAVTLAKQASK